MKNKKIQFLEYCLDFLEEYIRSEEQRLFFAECIFFLENHEQLPKNKLPGLTSTEKDLKTYDNWLKWLIKEIEKYKTKLWVNREQDLKELTRFPALIRKSSAGGSGNETYFYIDYISIDDIAETPTDSEAEAPIELTKVNYQISKLKRTPWYLKQGNRFFNKTKSRQALTLLLLLWMIIGPSIIIYSLFYSHTHMIQWTGIVLFTGFLLSFTSITNLIKLATRKIVLLDHILLPVSSVCISEVIPSKDYKKFSDINRELTSSIITGTCPICSQVHGIEKTVILEKASIFNSRIVGKCLNNPQEHVYTFDKDLMSGNKISNS